MIDIKIIRENPTKLQENLAKRKGFDTKIVDLAIEIDNSWRLEKSNLDKLKSTKNKESQNIAKIKKDGGDIKSQILKIKKISDEITIKDEKLKKINEKRENILRKIPNLLDTQVPIGDDEEGNLEIETIGKKPEFNFKIKNHQELCELNNWLELDIASKNCGARFYYLKNELVMLQLALYNFVFEKLQSKNYTPIEVPPMLRREALGKSVSLEDFAEAIYEIKGEDLCLIGTSEHALALLHADHTFQAKDLPKKYAGISQCFRKEAGVTKDEKGIFRVHNFNKIEQFIFSKPEDSDKFLIELLENAKEIFSELEIHYKVVDICSGDIGSFAARKFDIEAFLPGQNKYREMVSASNYRDYGARRLNCKYQDAKNQTKLIHTLNSTAIALTRTLIAIIETHQQEDGNIKLPKALRKYFNNQKYLINKK